MSPVKKDKIVVDKDEEQELPPGWKVEVKIRNRSLGSGTKIDRRYTDPVTGYIFLSLKDVHRYLKTGELGRLAIKPKNNGCVDMDNKDERLHMEEREEKSESKEQMSESVRCKRPLDKTESKFSEMGKSELRHRASKRLAAFNVVSPLPSSPVPESKTHQATGSVEVHALSQSSALTPKPKTRQATRLVGVAVDASPQSPPPLEAKIRKTKPVSLPQPKTRRATRQAGIKIDSPPPSPPDTRTSRQAARARLVNLVAPKENEEKTEPGTVANKDNENTDMDNNSYDNQEKSVIVPPVNQEINEKQELHNILPLVTPKEHNKEIEMGPATLLTPEDQAPPTVVPPVDFQKQKSSVVNPTVSNPVPQDASANFSMNDLWTDPCIEFAIKTLTGATPFGDLNKRESFTPSPLVVPLEELWADPCIEFAVKTLTGAIPVGEDGYLPPHPASSRNLQTPHDFYLPDVGMSFRQTDVLSKHFEAGQNKQQDL